MAISISRLVPLESENRWSDLLAALVDTDPQPAAALLGLGHGALTVRREATLQHLQAGAKATSTKKDRIDLLFDLDGRPAAAAEVKVLSGLGLRQLERYDQALPGEVVRI